jgi:UTP-glucose-1-phosphate uridylyltransferase
MKPTLVILAAGAGTRYGGLKQLAPIGPCGETLLEYSAFDALRAGFDRVVLVVRANAEQAFRDRLDGGLARRVPVSYVHQRLDDLPSGFARPAERTRPWGTGQAVLAAESQIDVPFAVVNADDFYGAESYVALSAFLAENPTGRSQAAVGFHVAETLADSGPVARALLEVDEEGGLSRIVEVLEVWRQEDRILYNDGDGRQQVLVGDELVSMNMWGFTPELLPQLRHSFARCLTQHGHLPDAEFLLPDRVSSVVACLISRGLYPKELWA